MCHTASQCPGVLDQCVFIYCRKYLLLVPRGGPHGPPTPPGLKHVGPMLALFFALGRFLGALGPLLRVSWLLLAVLGWFYRVRERSGVDFGGFGTLPGVFFKPLTLVFSAF